ncbi:MAG: thioredoxin [Tyzzerella sp.]|uniref:Thioredoxin n=1 Tax=Candidatus Fimicola merdigallinarum TaxID=2840819 RepID=A0A9D9DWY6_9FIRM|nr:thioredoxin [Candidatus Fimicola merdigallinarum]
MVSLKSEDFENSVLNNNKLVMIDFYAVWCGPCKMVSPIIEEIAEEYKDVCDVFKLDIDVAPDVATKYNVLAVPTIIFFKDGKAVDTIVGAVPKTELVSKIEKYK